MKKDVQGWMDRLMVSTGWIELDDWNWMDRDCLSRDGWRVVEGKGWMETGELIYSSILCQPPCEKQIAPVRRKPYLFGRGVLSHC